MSDGEPEPVFARPGVVVTELSLALPPTLPLDEWIEVGQELGRIHGGLNFWIGDWLNFGEAIYGEYYAQGMDVTGLAYSTLANVAHVARRVPVVNRRGAPLTWSHHAEVARLEDFGEQARWLNEAALQGWSARTLREQLRPKSAPSPTDPTPEPAPASPPSPTPIIWQTFRCSTCGAEMTDRTLVLVESRRMDDGSIGFRSPALAKVCSLLCLRAEIDRALLTTVKSV